MSGLILLLTQRKKTPKDRTLLLCDEIGTLGKVEAFVMAATLMRGWGLTLWSFWQNPDQLKVYGDQANTIVDNAGVVQLFGARNRRMAQEFVTLVGGVDADTVLGMGAGEQLLLIEGGRPLRCRQTRYYEDAEFKTRPVR
jgi:type IV secretion system protein VirD4